MPRGLKQKPIRQQGPLVGTRELSAGAGAESTLSIPKPKKDSLRVLFFGGCGEIGKNMYGLEYNDEILLLDCGMKFATEDTLGVDFLVPNIQYLEDRKDQIKGLVISHAHLDHIGGIPVILEPNRQPSDFFTASQC